MKINKSSNFGKIIKSNKKNLEVFIANHFKHLKPLNLMNNEPFIIYGAGTVGEYLIKKLLQSNLKIKNVVDGNPKKWGKKLLGVTIISPNKLKKDYRSYPIIIASVIYELEIYKSLLSQGFDYIYPLTYANYLFPKIFDFRKYNDMFLSLLLKKNKLNIINAYNLFEDIESKNIYSQIIDFRSKHYFSVTMDSIFSKHVQYLDKKIISRNLKEVFVDGGAYVGDTVDSFIKFSKNKYNKIYSFEPDQKNYKSLIKFHKNIVGKKLFPIQAGLYKTNEYLHFYQEGNPESTLIKKNSFSLLSGGIVKANKQTMSKIKVVSIDSYFKRLEAPTFIKMDIEGAEIDALLGARKIIKKYKPKLAICVYHHPNDLWEIPLLIKRLNPKYKLYLRHYSRELCETVCYAI